MGKLYREGVGVVGEVTSDGKVWVGENLVGSVDSDGKVWKDGGVFGTFDSGGKVWWEGRDVGFVTPDGAVWRDGIGRIGSVDAGNVGDGAALIFFASKREKITRPPVIRYDGVYYSPSSSDAGFTYYIRFYADGTVITVTSSGTIFDVKKWFTKDRKDISIGKFILVGDKIIFSSGDSYGSVDYNGHVFNDRLLLNSHSNINGHEETRQYRFREW